MELLKENTTRKVDSLGRVSIPKSMRDRLDIQTNDEVEFYLLNNDDGEQFVCLTNRCAHLYFQEEIANGKDLY